MNKAKAESIIKTKIADRLGVAVDEAAYMIREQMGRKTGEEIVRFAEEHGIGAGGLSDFAVVVYGGAGPTHYSDFARGLNFGHSVATPYASVFSAFGSSTTDVLHSYSKSARIELRSPKGYFSDYDFFNGIVTSLSEQARRDIRGEGFSPDNAAYFLELTGGGDLEGNKVRFDRMYLRSEDDVAALCRKFTAGEGPVSISAIALSASVPMPHLIAKTFEMASKDPRKAMKGSRSGLLVADVRVSGHACVRPGHPRARQRGFRPGRCRGKRHHVRDSCGRSTAHRCLFERRDKRVRP